MKTLKDLLNSTGGRRLLERKRIFATQNDFVEQVAPPVNPILAEHLGLENRPLIFSGQQTYVDCTQSMVDRMVLLENLARLDGLSTHFLWVDTDRAGSDDLMVKFFWPHSGQQKPIRLCARVVEDMEPRFIGFEALHLSQAMDLLSMYISQTIKGKERKERVKRKYEQLKVLFLQDPVETLAELNHRVAYFLLNNQANLNPASVILSDLLKAGILKAEINLLLNHLEAIITVFNQEAQALLQQEIDPQVGLLSEDYLPLNFSCPVDNRRLRLHREIKGVDQFAVATCKCGQHYRFYLGSKCLSMDEIGQTGRWSPDILLWVPMNDLISGFVAGKSSGIYYGLVMNDVVEKVLHKRRIPILIPESLGANQNKPEQVDSLIYHYLLAH
jgi:hypothetical protein